MTDALLPPYSTRSWKRARGPWAVCARSGAITRRAWCPPPPTRAARKATRPVASQEGSNKRPGGRRAGPYRAGAPTPRIAVVP